MDETEEEREEEFLVKKEKVDKDNSDSTLTWDER